MCSLLYKKIEYHLLVRQDNLPLYKKMAHRNVQTNTELARSNLIRIVGYFNTYMEKCQVSPSLYSIHGSRQGAWPLPMQTHLVYTATSPSARSSRVPIQRAQFGGWHSTCVKNSLLPHRSSPKSPLSPLLFILVMNAEYSTPCILSIGVCCFPYDL